MDKDLVYIYIHTQWKIVVVQSLSCVRLFETPWTVVYQTPLSFNTSRSLLKFMSFESVMPSNLLILCYPILLLHYNQDYFYYQYSNSFLGISFTSIRMLLAFITLMEILLSLLVEVPLSLTTGNQNISIETKAKVVEPRKNNDWEWGSISTS